MGYDSADPTAEGTTEPAQVVQPLRQANTVQQPTMAPFTDTPARVAARPTPQPAPQEAAPATYREGDLLVHKGVEYQFNGGDPSKMQNWTPTRVVAPPMQQATQVASPVPLRVVKGKVPTQAMPNAFSEALADNGVPGSLPFNDETDIPV